MNLNSLDSTTISELALADNIVSTDKLLISLITNNNLLISKSIEMSTLTSSIEENIYERVNFNLNNVVQKDDYDKKISYLEDLSKITLSNIIDANTDNIDNLYGITDDLTLCVNQLESDKNTLYNNTDKLSTDLSTLCCDLSSVLVSSENLYNNTSVLNIVKLKIKNFDDFSTLSINVPYATEDQDGIMTSIDRNILTLLNAIGEDDVDEDQESDDSELTLQSNIHILKTDSTLNNENVTTLNPYKNYIHATNIESDHIIDDNMEMPENINSDVSQLLSSNSGVPYLFSTDVTPNDNTDIQNTNKKIVGISYQSMLADIYARIKTMLTNDINTNVNMTVENTLNNSEIINNIKNTYGTEDNMVDVTQYKYLRTTTHTVDSDKINLYYTFVDFSIPIFLKLLLHINILLNNKNTSSTCSQNKCKILIINKRILRSDNSEEIYIIDELGYDKPILEYKPNVTFNFDKYIDVNPKNSELYKSNEYIVRIYSDESMPIKDVFEYLTVIVTQYSNDSEIFTANTSGNEVFSIDSNRFVSLFISFNFNGTANIDLNNIYSSINTTVTNNELITGALTLAVPLDTIYEQDHYYGGTSVSDDVEAENKCSLVRFPTYDYMKNGISGLVEFYTSNRKVRDGLYKALSAIYGQNKISSNISTLADYSNMSLLKLSSNNSHAKWLNSLTCLSNVNNYSSISNIFFPGEYIKTLYSNNNRPLTGTYNISIELQNTNSSSSSEINFNLSNIYDNALSNIYNLYPHGSITLKYYTNNAKKLSAIGIEFPSLFLDSTPISCKFKNDDAKIPQQSYDVSDIASMYLSTNKLKCLPIKYYCELYSNYTYSISNTYKFYTTYFTSKGSVNAVVLSNILSACSKFTNINNYANVISDRLFNNLCNIRNLNSLSTVAYLIKKDDNILGFDFVYDEDDKVISSTITSNSSSMSWNVTANEEYALLLNKTARRLLGATCICLAPESPLSAWVYIKGSSEDNRFYAYGTDQLLVRNNIMSIPYYANTDGYSANINTILNNNSKKIQTQLTTYLLTRGINFNLTDKDLNKLYFALSPANIQSNLSSCEMYILTTNSPYYTFNIANMIANGQNYSDFNILSDIKIEISYYKNFNLPSTTVLNNKQWLEQYLPEINNDFTLLKTIMFGEYETINITNLDPKKYTLVKIKYYNNIEDKNKAYKTISHNVTNYLISLIDDLKQSSFSHDNLLNYITYKTYMMLLINNNTDSDEITNVTT